MKGIKEKRERKGEKIKINKTLKIKSSLNT